MPEYVHGVELTQAGMHAIFERMGQDITSGIIYNGNPDVRVDKLDQQGFMPILTGVNPTQKSGHWIMLIKGQGNQYYLFDPLGEGSGKGYQKILAKKLPEGATLSVIPNDPGFNMGLCGYWVASAGVRAHTALTGDNPPTLENLGLTITQDMQNELAGNGYGEITGWLRAVAHEFPVDGGRQTEATALRRATEKDLHIEIPALILTGKTTTPKEIPTKPTASLTTPPSVLNSTLLENDLDVRRVVDYVHQEYLRHPYLGPLKDLKDPKGERIPPNEGPDRTTHGLAHTVRTMACAEVMVEEARKAKFRGEILGAAKDSRTLADVTPEELKKILIAQAFFVVGRDDERSGYDDKYKRNFYAEYHEKSEQAFRKYVEDNQLIGKIFKDPKEVDDYAAIIRDNPHNWDGTPAHVLIHQGHMVDLMRVKAPQEPVLEYAFRTLKNVVGSLGAEVVLKTHRDFLLATGAVVPSFNPQAKDDLRAEEPYENMINRRYVIEKDKTPQSLNDARCVAPDYQLKNNERFITIKEQHTIEENNIRSEEAKKSFKEGGVYENPYGGEKYVIEKGLVPNNKNVKRVNSDYQLKEKERFVTIKEYYAIPEIQQIFPGYNTQLGENPTTEFARTCEQNPSVCLGAIKEARQQVKMEGIKDALQSSSSKIRRQPNVDEIAAARIIQQIMANPDVIQDDHVLLNGEHLKESFFRGLLAKCDMAVVGSLLNDTDINNIDRLMLHEKDTEFHPTDPKDPAKKLGETWDITIRKKGGDYKDKIKYDLVFLMQNDGWYYSRVNAIAQNRDKGSTFKEVLVTALLTPLTSKALVDTNRVPSPKTLYRGLNFPEDFQNKLINQANTIIANSSKHLFTDLSAQDFMQIKLNDLSKISSRTNASNSVNIEVPRTIFGSNTIFEINDPDQLLHAKQVGTHIPESEDEFSFYLPDDVALIPTKVTLDGKNSKGEDRYIITFTTIKSPDFIPRYEPGFAVDSYIKMQNPKVVEAINAVHVENKETHENLNKKLETLRVQMEKQYHLPIRGGFLDKILHYFSGKDDQKISLERKKFLNDKVMPSLQQCHIGLRLNNIEMMQRALASFPSNEEWSGFKSDAAKAAKREMDNLRPIIEKKIALQSQLISLKKCQDALEKQHVADALKALESISSDKDMSTIPSISSDLREKIQHTKQEVTENLASLQRATVTSVLTNPEHVKKRYETLMTSITSRITALDKAKLDDTTRIKKELSHCNVLYEEVKLLRNEKARLQSETETVDFTDVEKLEEQLRTVHNKLYDAYVVKVTERISVLEQEKPKNLTAVKKMISSFNELLAEVESLRQEKIKKLEAATDPLNLSDVDGLNDRLQQVNQYLVKVLISNIRVSFNQMEVKTFAEQTKEVQQNLQILDKLATTLDDSETAKRQKANILKLNEFFVEKQKVYPAMVHLQFKSEALIIQLRELCDVHQSYLAESRKEKTETITKNRWMLQGLTDLVGLTTDERPSLTKEGNLLDKFLDQFKKDLNNDKCDIKELMNKLTKKSPDKLKKATGISTEYAEKLHTLLKQLSHSTTSVDKIEQRSKLCDDILSEFGKQISMQQVVKEQIPQDILDFDYF